MVQIDFRVEHGGQQALVLRQDRGLSVRLHPDQEEQQQTVILIGVRSGLEQRGDDVRVHVRVSPGQRQSHERHFPPPDGVWVHRRYQRHRFCPVARDDGIRESAIGVPSEIAMAGLKRVLIGVSRPSG